MERSEEALRERVRETPLSERLKTCEKYVASMCAERRPPKMTIPLQHYDEDFYIYTTLADAQATIVALQADNRTYINERHENTKQIEQLQADLAERTAELEAAKASQAIDLKNNNEYREQVATLQAELKRVRGERDEAVEAAARPTWVCDGCGRASSEGWINRVIESLDGTEYEMECPACEGRNIEEDSASDLARERDDLRTLILALPKVEGEIQATRIPCAAAIGEWWYVGWIRFPNERTAQSYVDLLRHRQGMEG